MQFKVVQRILGVLLLVFSLTMLPPIAISYWLGEGAAVPFEIGFIVILGLGLLLWLPARGNRQELRVREGFLVVSLFWVVLSLAAALPFMLSNEPHLDLAGAFFEAVSGFTTTGATVIIGLDRLPKSMLFYRMELHWLGGMGIVVLAVAVLPMLGGGGMQLFRAETPGPIKDAKLTPRIKETAKALWYVYVGLTGACALAFWAGGMGLFDAVTHAFSTLSTGGFSNYDASFGHFQSPLLEWIAIVFMLLAGANFALHFVAWNRRNLQGFLRDTEFKAYLTVFGVITLAVGLELIWVGQFPNWGEALRQSAFHTASILTTTGFTVYDYSLWPGFAAMILLLSSFIGGCAGSTSGGIKVVRFTLLVKQGMREVTQLIHPSAEVPIRIGGKVVPPRVISGIWGFFAVYVGSFTLMYLAVALTGLDLISAFSGVAACMNNMGPGLGSVSVTYAEVSDAAKWIFSFAMLLGRLEVFTLLVILTPTYWRW